MKRLFLLGLWVIGCLPLLAQSPGIPGASVPFFKPAAAAAGGGGPATNAWITDVSSIGAFDLFSNLDGEIGVFITPATNLTIRSLGRYKVAGNSSSHTIKVYTSLGTLIDSVSVNLSGGSAGTFVYANKNIVLFTNNSYYIQSTEANGGDTWYANVAPDATTSGLLSSFAKSTDLVEGTASRDNGPVNFKASIEGAPFLEETFGGANYLLADWTEVGTPNEDFPTTGLSMDGAECLNLTAGGSDVSTRHDFTATAEVQINGRVRFNTLATGAGNFFYLSDGSSIVCIMEMDIDANAGRVRIYNGSSGSALTSALSADTTYSFQLRYKKGTGANGRASIDFGGGITANVTNGDATTDVSRIQFILQAGMGADVYWDSIIVTR